MRYKNLIFVSQQSRASRLVRRKKEEEEEEEVGEDQTKAKSKGGKVVESCSSLVRKKVSVLNQFSNTSVLLLTVLRWYLMVLTVNHILKQASNDFSKQIMVLI